MSKKPNKSDIIVCRCEDVTLQQVEDLIDGGITDPEEIKRFLRIGMGPCQGRTCGKLVTRIIAQKTGKPAREVKSTTKRPPLVSIRMHELLGDDHE